MLRRRRLQFGVPKTAGGTKRSNIRAMPNLEIRRPASVPALAAIDDSLPLARARQIVARLLETPEGTGGWFTGYAPLDPRFGPAFVRRLLKQMALGHPLNMAQLTAVARAGGLAGEAARAVNELIAEFLEARQELPVALAAYVQEILGPRPPLPRHRHGKSKATNLMADISICILVTLLIEEFDLKPTRRPRRGPRSRRRAPLPRKRCAMPASATSPSDRSKRSGRTMRPPF